MPNFNFRVTDDLTVPIQADNQQDALKILKAELAKKEASPAFDAYYFDYEKGLKSKKLRSLLGLAEKRDQSGKELEKEQLLQNYVGSRGFTYNTKGDLAITPEGQKTLVEKGLYDENDITDKNVVIDERGFSSGDFLDFAGVVGPVFGAVAALSPHLRGVSLLKKLLRNDRFSRMVAAGIGTAGGKGAEEALEVQQGFQLQSDKEVQDLMENEFLYGFFGQGIGEAIGTGFAAFFGKKAPIENVRDAYVVSKGYDMNDVLKLDQDLGRLATEKDIAKAFKEGKITDLGARAAVSQQFLGRAIPGRMQGIGETIAGKQGRERGLIDYNMAMLAQLRKKLADSRAALDNATGIEDAGLAQSEIVARRAQLEKSQNEVTNYLNKMMQDLSEQTGGFGPIMQATDQAALGKSVQDTIKNSYKTLQSDFRNQYNKIFDDLDVLQKTEFDNKVRADLSELNEFIKKRINTDDPLLLALDDDISLKTVLGLHKQIEKGAFSGGATISQLIKARSALANSRITAGLNPGEQGLFVKEISDKLDDIIYKLPDNLLIISGKAGDPQLLRNKVELLKELNESYFKQIQPFNNAIVQKIKNNKIDADDVYTNIVKANRSGDMQDILNAAGKDTVRGTGYGEITKNYLRTELVRRLFKDAVDTATDPTTGVFNPSKYVGNIKKYGATLRPLLGNNYDKTMQALDTFNSYSPKLAPKEVFELADKIRVVGPEVPVVGPVRPTDDVGTTFQDFANALTAKAKASDELLQFQQNRVLANIENASPEVITQSIFRPNSAAAINQVRNEISEEAFINVQDEALEELIKKSITPGGTDLTEIFKPGNFQRALNSYGDETLDAMFGKELSQALRGYARAINTTVSGAERTGAGSIVAGTLAAGFFNLNLLPTVATLTIYKTLFANPKIVSLLSRTDKSAMGQVLDAVEQAIRIGGFSALFRETGVATEDITREIEETGITEQAREVINQVAVPAKVELDLPDINLSQAPTGARTRIGPTLLPNPRDQEIAELLS